MSTPPEQFLKSLGFDFDYSHTYLAYPPGYDFEKFLNRHHRLECRKQILPEEYGRLFEGLVFDLLYQKFDFDLLRNVKIKDEGSGGDYDILAFTSPHLLYVECKTSSDLNFGSIFTRHQFLRPALTLVLIDQPKDIVSDCIEKEVVTFLTQYAKKNDSVLAKKDDYKYPVELISEADVAYKLFHAFRNIFIASGEDLERIIKKTLRYFHQVVQQTSYWS